MATPKIMTGARAIFKVTTPAGEKTIAYATNVSYRIAIPSATVVVLGRYSAARIEPLGVDVTVNCGVLRFTGVSGSGNSPVNPSLQIQPTLQQLINSEDIKIEIRDRKTNEPVLLVTRAKLTDRGGNIGARDMASENWTFIGIWAVDGDALEQEESSSPGPIPPNTEAAQ